jgi:hypothetical protein
MALSTQAQVLAYRRLGQWVSGQTERASTSQLLQALKSYISQNLGDIDLEVKPFTFLTGTDTVIANVACKIYAIVLRKATAAAAYFKGSDHATVSSSTAPEIELRQNTADKEDILIFPDGLAMANGFTVSSDTTSDGNTTSAAGDGAKGAVLLGAA